MRRSVMASAVAPKFSPLLEQLLAQQEAAEADFGDEGDEEEEGENRFD